VIRPINPQRQRDIRSYNVTVLYGLLLIRGIGLRRVSCSSISRSWCSIRRKAVGCRAGVFASGKSSGRPIINEFTGQPFHIALARRRGSFEFTYAEIGLGTTSVTGDMTMAYEDSWAHYCRTWLTGGVGVVEAAAVDAERTRV
jgi:hypothetical protein